MGGEAVRVGHGAGERRGTESYSAATALQPNPPPAASYLNAQSLDFAPWARLLVAGARLAVDPKIHADLRIEANRGQGRDNPRFAHP